MFMTADECMEISTQNNWVLTGVNERLEELYGDKESLTSEDWKEIRRRTDSELLLIHIRSDTETVLGVAQATYSFRPPYPKVYVNSVVVHKACRGQSAGTGLMRELHARCLQRWPRTQFFSLQVRQHAAPGRSTRDLAM